MNPVIDLLPLITFVTIDNFCGLKLALACSIPLALAVAAYFFFFQQQIFNWHAIIAFMVLSVGFVISVLTDFKEESQYRPVISEMVCSVFLFVLLLCRKPMKRWLLTVTKHIIPMENNLDEFFRVAVLFLIAFSIHAVCFFLIKLIFPANSDVLSVYLRNSYTFLLLLLMVYEYIRVYFIRHKLQNEEWWPIIDKHGNVIGSVPRSVSWLNASKYLHPVVRVHLMQNGMLLLQKRKETDIISPTLWDTAISNHMRYGESVEKCIERTAQYNYGIEGLQPSFVSNYNHEALHEIQAAFLFYAPYDGQIQVNKKCVETVKWWTVRQIQENLQSGIFSENFEKEFTFLMQEGIISSEH